MKKGMKSFSLILAFAIVGSYPMVSIASKGETKKPAKNFSVDIKREKDEDKVPQKEWREIRNTLKEERKVLNEAKEALEAQIENLEAQLEDALESGDTATAESLKSDFDALKTKFMEQKNLIKAKITEKQQVMREKYTNEEWDKLMENAKELEDFPGIKLLPAENILMPGKNLKFDVPPVLKSGRLLVPIRALSTALGADVEWNNETRTATIVFDGKTIEIAMSNENILVNGSPVETDVPAEIINGRIVVPLRFIIENMGLEIEWDQDTQTAEVMDDSDFEDEEEELEEDTVDEPADIEADDTVETTIEQ